MHRASTHLLFLVLFLLWAVPAICQQKTPLASLSANAGQQLFEPSFAKKGFELDGMIPGKTYKVSIQITDPIDCLPDIKSRLEPLSQRSTSQFLMYYFKATAEKELFQTGHNCQGVAVDSLLVHSKCMDCPETSATPRSQAVISTRGNIDPDYLVKDVFVGGGCFDVGNITFKGPGEARGTFSQGMESIDMEEGVILSTGNVRNAVGPNNENNAGNAFSPEYSGDADLARLLPFGSSSILDVAVLEFDFTPTTDHVSFRYVFASEEYCEYVGTQFNDVFGFFISGPGINGSFTNNAINIATVPGSADYVSINNVNFTSNKNYYHDNVGFWDALINSCKLGEIFGGTKAKDEIEYDGFTKILTAEAAVIPCETYHIKLAVGDVGDPVFDSAVFLEANSFDLGDPAELGVNIPEATFPDSNLVYESCQESYFVFKRTEDSDRTQPQVVPFEISDLSTATPYADYLPILSPVIIPAFQDSIAVPVTIFEDDEIEGQESIIFELETACTCEGILTELIITEPEPFQIAVEDITTCPSSTINITPVVDGGVGALTYQWNNDETGSTLTTTVEEATTYQVTVTDQCKVEATAEIMVNVAEQTALLGGEKKSCNGEVEGAIIVQFEGEAPYSLEYLVNGQTRTLAGIEESTFTLPANEPGTYEAISMSSKNCQGSGTGIAEYVDSSVEIAFTKTDPKCASSSDGKIALNLPEGENFNINWENSSTETQIDQLPAGEYRVQVENAEGCASEATITLTAPDPVIAEAAATAKATCASPTGGRIELVVNGGTPEYTFDWSGDALDVQNPDNLAAGTYKVTVYDANNCQSSTSVTVEEDMEPPTAVTQSLVTLTCKEPFANLTSEGSSEGTVFGYEWTSTDGQIFGNNNQPTLEVSQPGQYDLVVINQENGCQATARAKVESDQIPPAIDIAAPENINCANEMIQLEGAVMDALNNYTVQWTTENGNLAADDRTMSPSVDTEGAYTMIVTNEENGCTSETTVQVIADVTPPALSITPPDNITCDRKNITLAATVDADNNTDWQVEWSTENGNFLENKTSLTPVVNQSGIYSVKVTNPQNHCFTTTRIEVGIDTIAPIADAGEGGVFSCSVQSISLEGSVTNASQYEVNWTSENGNIIGGAKSLQPLVNVAGRYDLTITNLENGCQATDFVMLEDDQNRPEVQIATPAPLTCTRNEVQLDASLSNQQPNYDYTWTTADGNIIDQSDQLRPVVAQAGDYLLEIHDRTNDCTGRQRVTVVLDTIRPKAALSGPDYLNCKNPETQLVAEALNQESEWSFEWTTPDGHLLNNSNTATPTVDAIGTYQVEIINEENGCIGLATFTLAGNSPEAIELQTSQPACEGDLGRIDITLVEGGVAPYSFSLDGGSRFVRHPNFMQLQPGEYEIMVKDQNDCELSIQETINEPIPLAASIITEETHLYLGDTSTMTLQTNIPPQEIADIIWSPAEGLSCSDCWEPMVLANYSTNYEVEVIDQNGCTTHTTVSLVVDRRPRIFVPNAVRPDSENGNDRFTIFAKPGLVREILSLQIFDRWGESVFVRKNFQPNLPELGWDGYFNRQAVRSAVFVYRAEVELVNGETLELKGDVTLLK